MITFRVRIVTLLICAAVLNVTARDVRVGQSTVLVGRRQLLVRKSAQPVLYWLAVAARTALLTGLVTGYAFLFVPR